MVVDRKRGTPPSLPTGTILRPSGGRKPPIPHLVSDRVKHQGSTPPARPDRRRGLALFRKAGNGHNIRKESPVGPRTFAAPHSHGGRFPGADARRCLLPPPPARGRGSSRRGRLRPGRRREARRPRRGRLVQSRGGRKGRSRTRRHPGRLPSGFHHRHGCRPAGRRAKATSRAKNNAQKELPRLGERAEAAGGEAVYILVAKDVAHGWFGKAYGCVVVTVPAGAHCRIHRGRRPGAARPLGLVPFGTEHSPTTPPVPPWPRCMTNCATTCCRPSRGCKSARFPDRARPVGRPAWWCRRLTAADPCAGPEPARLALYGGLLGGLFGTAASHWIYDTLFVVASRHTAGKRPRSSRVPKRLPMTSQRRPTPPPPGREEPAEEPDTAAATRSRFCVILFPPPFR